VLLDAILTLTRISFLVIFPLLDFTTHSRAEYMLDVIGAGATASTLVDWNSIWKNSPDAARLQEEIENIYNEGLARPVVQAAQPTEFATSWPHQLMALTQRNFQAYWRNLIYLMAKFALCIVGGLLIGFTFYKQELKLVSVVSSDGHLYT
jgi:hypothetical protein